eukprot:1149025_1
MATKQNEALKKGREKQKQQRKDRKERAANALFARNNPEVYKKAIEDNNDPKYKPFFVKIDPDIKGFDPSNFKKEMRVNAKKALALKRKSKKRKSRDDTDEDHQSETEEEKPPPAKRRRVHRRRRKGKKKQVNKGYHLLQVILLLIPMQFYTHPCTKSARFNSVFSITICICLDFVFIIIRNTVFVYNIVSFIFSIKYPYPIK